MGTAVLPQFRRPHHQKIAELLKSFDANFLLRAECFFGGGTAIALALDEYRESIDIDFLCSSQEGFRFLRSAVHTDLGPLMREPVVYARDVTSNQYKILTVLEVDGIKVKVEIIREGNTTLAGEIDPSLGVPVLSRTDLWAQKLMANADRALDKSTMSRDIIDLAMMLRGWGPLPRAALDKAQAAYGDAVAKGFNNALHLIVSDSSYLVKCMDRMGMEASLVDEIILAIDDASAALPLNSPEKSEYDRRVRAIASLEQSSGAAFVFWQAASQALAYAKGGEANWAQVERNAASEAILNPGVDAQEMIEVIERFSPSTVSPLRAKAVEARVLKGLLRFEQADPVASLQGRERFRASTNPHN